MAHSCPECDQVCHCGGDIDDMILDDTVEQAHCTHWKQCQAENEDYDDYEGCSDKDDDDVWDFGRVPGKHRSRPQRKPGKKSRNLRKQSDCWFIYIGANAQYRIYSKRSIQLAIQQGWDLPF